MIFGEIPIKDSDLPNILNKKKNLQILSPKSRPLSMICLKILKNLLEPNFNKRLTAKMVLN